MTQPKIYLIIQDNCPSCLQAKTRLRKVENWNKVITVIKMYNSEGKVNSIAEKHEITATPTLFAIEGDELKASVKGSDKLTKSFLTATVKKYMVDEPVTES